MKRGVKWIAIVLGTVTVLYFGAVALSYRNYWAKLFWETYLPWIPAYDIVEGPKKSIETRAQYEAATQFIRERMLTPSTAKFCPFAEAKFGTEPRTGLQAMLGWVDAQNTFGAMIRNHFKAVFRKDNIRQIDHIQWSDEAGQIWR